MLCREIAGLSCPLVYMDYMEFDAEAWGPEEVKVMVDKTRVLNDIKVELAPIDLCNEGLMVSQSVSGSK